MSWGTSPWGRFLYVDDLVTAPEHRGAGHASTLLSALDQLSGDERCAAVHLDSGVGEDRRDAHRRYFGHGMRISGYHFAKPLPCPLELLLVVPDRQGLQGRQQASRLVPIGPSLRSRVMRVLAALGLFNQRHRWSHNDRLLGCRSEEP